MQYNLKKKLSHSLTLITCIFNKFSFWNIKQVQAKFMKDYGNNLLEITKFN